MPRYPIIAFTPPIPVSSGFEGNRLEVRSRGERRENGRPLSGSFHGFSSPSPWILLLYLVRRHGAALRVVYTVAARTTGDERSRGTGRGRRPMGTRSQVGREKWAGPLQSTPEGKGEGKGGRGVGWTDSLEDGRAVDAGSVGSWTRTSPSPLPRVSALCPLLLLLFPPSLRPLSSLSTPLSDSPSRVRS